MQSRVRNLKQFKATKLILLDPFLDRNKYGLELRIPGLKSIGGN